MDYNRWTLKTCWVREASHKRPPTVWFFLYEVSRIGKFIETQCGCQRSGEVVIRSDYRWVRAVFWGVMKTAGVSGDTCTILWMYCCCCCLVTKSCQSLCNPVDCSPPGSSVHAISQTRIMEWLAISFSRRSSRPRDWTWVSCIAGDSSEPPGKLRNICH